MANTVNILLGQTIPDIAMQQCGSCEAMFGVAIANGVSITTLLAAGAAVAYTSPAYNSVVAKVFSDGGYKPKSFDGVSQTAAGGIGVGIIGSTFIVS